MPLHAHTTQPPHHLACPYGTGEPYTLLMICRDPAVAPLDKQRIAEAIAGSSCAHFCAWGFDAQEWENQVDLACVMSGILGAGDRFIMTTQHSADPVDDAVFYAATVVPGFGDTDDRLLVWFMLPGEPNEKDRTLIERVTSLL